MSRKKALKRKLGKKVLAGKLTVTEARARLGRETAQRARGAEVRRPGLASAACARAAVPGG